MMLSTSSPEIVPPNAIPKQVSTDARPARATLLPPTESSPRAACEFTRETLASWRLASALDNVEVIVNELVTNAVLHAEGAVTLELSVDGGCVHIEVSDDSAAMPSERPFSDSRPNGRGLGIVAALSTAWGTSPAPTGGKMVWADVHVGHMLTVDGPISDPLTVRTTGVFSTQLRALLTRAPIDRRL
jgi:hypothetical protein